MLHPSQTRYDGCIINALKTYFLFAFNIDQIDTAKTTDSNLNATNEIYLSFLKYILEL